MKKSECNWIIELLFFVLTYFYSRPTKTLGAGSCVIEYRDNESKFELNINSWTWIGIYVVPIHFQSPKKHFSQLHMSRPVILSTHTTFLLFNYVIKWKNILPDDNDNDIIIKSFDQNIDFTNFLYTYLYLSNHFVFFPNIFFRYSRFSIDSSRVSFNGSLAKSFEYH